MNQYVPVHTQMATARMTFSVPQELKKRAREHPEINWSGVVAGAIRTRLAAEELAKRIGPHAPVTEEEIDEIAHRINRAMAKRLRDEA